MPAGGLDRAERIYHRWGVWTLLLSWVPVVGDPLTLVAGVLKTPKRVFLALVIAAKLGRYLVVLGAINLWTGVRYANLIAQFRASGVAVQGGDKAGHWSVGDVLMRAE